MNTNEVPLALDAYRTLGPRRVRKLIRFLEGQLELNPTDGYRARLQEHLQAARAALPAYEGGC